MRQRDSHGLLDTKEYYDKMALVYEHSRHYGYHKFLDDTEAALAREFVADRDVLEVGCGTGLIMRRLEKVAKRICGVDLSEGMLRVARSRQLHVAQADATSLPFADESFDAVVCFKVLAHVQDVRTALAEMARVLRPGGHLIAEFYNKHSLRYLVKRLKGATRVVEDVSDQDVYTRYDTLEDVRSMLPRELTLVRIGGIRVVVPLALVFGMKAVGPAISKLEGMLARSPLGRFGGFLVVVATKGG